jgi:hypothetical protein
LQPAAWVKSKYKASMAGGRKARSGQGKACSSGCGPAALRFCSAEAAAGLGKQGNFTTLLSCCWPLHRQGAQIHWLS